MTPQCLVLAFVATCVSGISVREEKQASSSFSWSGTSNFVIAHRGGVEEAPENTMFAFKQAIAAGANALEIDVLTSSSGDLVVIHDVTVDRTTSGTGNVIDLSTSDLKALDAAAHTDGKWDAQYRGIATGAKAPPAGYTADDFKVPTLREVLTALPGVPLMIEMKTSASVAPLAALLQEFGRAADVGVFSYADADVAAFQALAPTVPTGPGHTEATQWLGALLQGHVLPLGHDLANIPFKYPGLGLPGDVLASSQVIAPLTAMGKAVFVFFDSGDENVNVHAYVWTTGTNGMLTDYPSILASSLAPPTPAPPTAGANGDPHCTNMRGEHFDVYKRGKISMVTIPQGRDPAEADFSITVVVTPTWWKKCAASFISLAVITHEAGCEQITIRTGDGLMPAVEILPNAERSCNQTSTTDKIGEATVMLKVGERSIKFWQTTKYDKYLNMEVFGLANEKQKVGGILGLDEHDEESDAPEECKDRNKVNIGEPESASISLARVL